MSHNPTIGPSSLKKELCNLPEYDPEFEVLIKIEATAVNRADLLQVRFLYSYFLVFSPMENIHHQEELQIS
jgi:NADPH:quinone reductase-like Zn-dependent oxidoreductase